MSQEIDWLQVHNTETGVELPLDEDTSVRVWTDPDSEELEVIIQAIASGVIASEQRTRQTPYLTREQVEAHAEECVQDMIHHHKHYGF